MFPPLNNNSHLLFRFPISLQFLLNREQASAVRLLCFQLLLGGGGCGKSYAIKAVLSFAKSWSMESRCIVSATTGFFFFFEIYSLFY